MSASFNHNRAWLYLRGTAVFALFLLVSGAALGQDPHDQNHPPRIVAIDPGHGGHDTGARGSENLLEKHVAIRFSKILADQLKTKYKVLLTRTDDYDVPFEDRVAKSNHAQADLFISIHTGGSLLHNLSGVSIFYYEKPPGSAYGPDTAAHAATAVNQLALWDVVTPEHIERSRYLAELIKLRLLENNNNLKLTITGVPLFVAVGADMPTLLIEIGYVTNPGDAQLLNNTEVLIGYAGSILKAVDDFFSNKLRL